MSGLFSPKMPKVPDPIKPPTTDDARQAEDDLARLRRRRGLASTFLAGRTRRAGMATQQLLGASDSAASPGLAPGGGTGEGRGSNQAPR